MKCYYEVLGVTRTVDDDDLKKAYRKLALQWHPDKNLSNSEEAKEQFQLVQQAYEVLSDSQERAWYDRHRDAILKGGIGDNYKDESLDVYQYFTSSCYVGYNDDDKGFYAVYSEVFNKIAAEDSEFNDDLDSDFEIPTFGKSDTLYDEVNAFYCYWQSYTTKKTYSWLDIYDIRQADNRKVLRLIEKENKKVRDTARKERNEEVRALVAFVRKRDKRIQAHAKFLQEKASENARKAEQNRLVKIKQRKEEIDSCKEVEWSKFSNLERELKDIEANLAAEFNDEFSDCSMSSKEDDVETNSSSLYCVACNKIFKTVKAFANHENSKKHKENVDILKHDMKKEDDDSSLCASDEYLEDSAKNCIGGISNSELDENNICKPCINESTIEENQIDADLSDRSDCSNSIIKNNDDSDISIELKDNSEIFEKESLRSIKKSKKKHKHKSSDVLTSDDEFDPLVYQNKKQRKKQLQQHVLKNKIQQEDESVTIGLAKENLEEEKPEFKTKSKKTKKQLKVTSECNGDKVSIQNEEELFSKINKGKRKSKKNIAINEGKQNDIKEFNTLCAMCHTAFSSRQKLFDHLSKTGHAVPLPSTMASSNKKVHKK